MEKQQTIFEFLKQLAEQKAGKKDINVYHMLYSYAQLLSLNQEVLEKLLDSESNRKEVQAIQAQAKEYDLDINIMKRGITLILMANPQEECCLQSIMEKVEKESEESDSIPADILFSRIVETNPSTLGMFKKGKTLEDIFQYKARLDEINKQKKQEDGIAPEKEKTPEKKSAESKGEKRHTKPAEIKTEERPTDEKWKRFNDLALSSQNLYYELREFVKGQDDAVSMFVQGYFQAELLADTKRGKENPRGVFLFAGPPGVGKTLLAEKAAQLLQIPAKRFNMSQYSDGQSTMELIGLSKKYSGAARGILTSFVQQNPRCILIFDEIEKAHLSIIHLFLQILDAGILQDNYDEKSVNFKDTLIIFTTNVGEKLYEENRETNLSQLSQTVILDALQKEVNPMTGRPLFPAAICSRFAAGNIIMFNHLSCHYLLQIAQKQFEQHVQIMREKYNYEVTFDEKVASVFLFSQSSNMDARIISSQSGQFIRNELYEFARQAMGVADLGKLRKISFVVKLPEKHPEIIDLFRNRRTAKILIMGNEEFASIKNEQKHKIEFLFVDSEQEMKELIARQDITLLLIDPRYGYSSGMENGFSMDDLDTEGMRSFKTIRMLMPQIPIYILETGVKMREVEKNTFQQLGARGTVSFMDKNQETFCQNISRLADEVYLQEKINEMTRQEKTLWYNTAQKVSDDGATALIEFYDFEIRMGIRAEHQGTLLEDRKKPSTRFDDIVGAKNAKEELKYFIQYLEKPKDFMLKGFKPPKGVLLYGPPGTGKTMLARAMAGEAGVAFLPTTATDFLNKFVGEGEAKIRSLFAAARKYAPSVIFIDEIDAIAKERTGGNGAQYTEVLLNALLTEMDGFSFDPQRPVFVLAATNFPLEREKSNGKAVIDAALLRRFDNKIYVDLPNQEERKEFLEKCAEKLKNVSVTEDALSNIAERTTGVSLAVMQNIVDLALRNAERKQSKVTDAVILNAMEEYFYGEEHKWGREYYENVAHHESGHAYLCYLSGKKPSFITIVSRGEFGGYMQSESDENVPSHTREQLLWRIRTALAGRAAELVFCGETQGNNTGVAGDLQTATNLALQMICRYGMSGDSLLSFEPDRLLNTSMGESVLKQANSILMEEMERTIQLIREGKEKIEQLSKILLEKNQLMGNEIEKVLKD